MTVPAGGRRALVFDPPTGARPWHYLVAMVLVAGVLAGAGRVLDRASSTDVPSETQGAIVVDLPPVEAGARPPGDDAPTQQAAPDAAGAAPPPKPAPVEPPKPAVVEIPKVPPPQQPAPAAAPQEAHEAGGPQAARTDARDADEAETHQAPARLITLWQKALMARLQAARHGLPHDPHMTGIAKVAFEIDRDGRLVAARIAHGSGSAALDAAALTLVRRAAPYPAPPRDSTPAQLSFVVPISFRR